MDEDPTTWGQRLHTLLGTGSVLTRCAEFLFSCSEIRLRTMFSLSVPHVFRFFRKENRKRKRSLFPTGYVLITITSPIIIESLSSMQLSEEYRPANQISAANFRTLLKEIVVTEWVGVWISISSCYCFSKCLQNVYGTRVLVPFTERYRTTRTNIL